MPKNKKTILRKPISRKPITRKPKKDKNVNVTINFDIDDIFSFWFS